MHLIYKPLKDYASNYKIMEFWWSFLKYSDKTNI